MFKFKFQVGEAQVDKEVDEEVDKIDSKPVSMKRDDNDVADGDHRDVKKVRKALYGHPNKFWWELEF